MQSIDYKGKYQKIKMEMIRNMKRSYQLGYADGAKDKEQESMMIEKQAQMQQDQMNAQMGMDPNAPQDPNQMAEDINGQGAIAQDQALDQNVTELDSLISELEQAVGGETINKSEVSRISSKISLKKNEIKKLQQLKKSEPKKIAKNLAKASQIKAMTNLSAGQKKVLDMQKSLVEKTMTDFSVGKEKAIDTILSNLFKSEKDHGHEHK